MPLSPLILQNFKSNQIFKSHGMTFPFRSSKWLSCIVLNEVSKLWQCESECQQNGISSLDEKHREQISLVQWKMIQATPDDGMEINLS